MADFEKLSDEMLGKVVGGRKLICEINTHSNARAVIRTKPALNSGVVTSLENETVVTVDDDGVYNYADGRTWYKISSPVKGWVVGRSVGLAD